MSCSNSWGMALTACPESSPFSEVGALGCGCVSITALAHAAWYPRKNVIINSFSSMVLGVLGLLINAQ